MIEKKLAISDKTLLLTGPTGSGKSRKAKLCHQMSSRKEERFFHVNLCNFAPGVFESELFGHRKGAFTGALVEKEGFLKAVGKGTLFLDEVGDLSMETQAKLLMVLEEKLFYPVGAVEPQVFRGRIIFATNKNLEDMISKGQFREDLFHRLRLFEIEMDSLASKKNLLEILEDFFTESKAKAGKQHMILSEEIVAFLLAYQWPGNYRELKNLMEYFVLMADSIVTREHLPKYMRSCGVQKEIVADDYHQAIQMFERNFLERMLRKRSFRINQTSREININKVTLLSKIRKYDIKRESEHNVSQRAV